MRCKYCKQERSENDFEICRVVNGKAYRRLRCCDCKRELTNQRVGNVRKWLAEYKTGLRCSRCGFADFRALQFHHVGSDKSANVADMVRQKLSRQRLEAEIAKCVVLCANCHLITHYELARRSVPHTDL